MKRCPNCGRWWDNPEVKCPDCDVALERNEVEDDGFSSEDADDGFVVSAAQGEASPGDIRAGEKVRRHVIHTSCYIPGLLSIFTGRRLKKVITLDESEKHMTEKQLRTYLQAECAKGNVYLPMTECPTFDPKVGCRCSATAIKQAMIKE